MPRVLHISAFIYYCVRTAGSFAVNSYLFFCCKYAVSMLHLCVTVVAVHASRVPRIFTSSLPCTLFITSLLLSTIREWNTNGTCIVVVSEEVGSSHMNCVRFKFVGEEQRQCISKGNNDS